MDSISKIKLNDTEYEIKDAVARAGGGAIVMGVVTEEEIPKQITFDNPIFVVATDNTGVGAWGINPEGVCDAVCENSDVTFDGKSLTVGDTPCTYFAILED